ncbi:hypothetical protein L1887_18609 [Cichorium endivia]|nr:hypothetical protein L1887_18609 [Cichorium endivia]
MVDFYITTLVPYNSHKSQHQPFNIRLCVLVPLLRFAVAAPVELCWTAVHLLPFQAVYRRLSSSPFLVEIRRRRSSQASCKPLLHPRTD